MISIAWPRRGGNRPTLQKPAIVGETCKKPFPHCLSPHPEVPQSIYPLADLERTTCSNTQFPQHAPGYRSVARSGSRTLHAAPSRVVCPGAHRPSLRPTRPFSPKPVGACNSDMAHRVIPHLLMNGCGAHSPWWIVEWVPAFDLVCLLYSTYGVAIHAVSGPFSRRRKAAR